MASPQPHSLLSLFALECEEQVAAMHACLPALGSGEQAVRAGALAAVADHLHTLAGAARSVELLELEYLCRAAEALWEADLGADDGQARREQRLALFSEVLTLAPTLLVAPGGRLRNQLMALTGRCQGFAGAGGSTP